MPQASKEKRQEQDTKQQVRSDLKSLSLSTTGLNILHPSGKGVILHDLNFTIPAGSLTMLIGTNGIGKTTLLRALAGLDKSTGRISYGTTELSTISVREQARYRAYIGQEESIAPGFSVYESIGLARIPFPRDKAKDDKLINHAIKALELDDLAHRPLGSLSGGQKRRALIARALAQDVPLIILDEPLNHLDIHHQIHLVNTLRATGRTVIMSVHDLDLAYQCADHIMLIDEDGLHFGSPEEIATAPRLSSAFGVSLNRARTFPEEHLIISYPTQHKA
ncbi:MAG: ABC transporter ATP-binding protein [Corynebacterium sp.]|nr:ABC transporter ATP-binding protein [Corynebacterium sp.]